MKFALWIRALPLIGISAVEMAGAFIRALILTHLLGPYEYGLAVAISATYATFDQITDLAVHRFVLSSPRAIGDDAIDAAHAVAVVKGVVVAIVILFTAWPIACTFQACGDGASFAWLAVAMMLRCFDHLEIRVTERDYRYSRQLYALLLSHAAGLLLLVATAARTGSHYGVIAFLVGQAAVYLAASHLLASRRYAVKFNSALVRRCFGFGVPLMLNGVGLAVIGQGDRLMVGAILGVAFLGPYAVLTLAALIPISGLIKVIGPLQFAGLHNVPVASAAYGNRLELFSRAVPMIAATYALGIVALLKAVVPAIFGGRFVVSDGAMALLALIAYFRIARMEPHTSLLLNAQQTRSLALANQSTAIGLVVATVLVVIRPSIESALVGGAIGDGVGLAVFTWMTRDFLRSVRLGHLVSLIGMLVVVLAAAATVLATDSGDVLVRRVEITSAFFVVVLAAAAISLPRPYAVAYQERLPSV